MNIELHTCSEVDNVEGTQGNFQVTLRKHPRFIDLEACTGCGDCAKVCPVVRPSEYDMKLGTRKAVYKPYAQAIPGAFAIEKLDKAPCGLACPANLNVQGYVQMVKEGKYREAVEIIMKDLPLPGVLGRVCPHPCEKSCRRLEVDEPIAIRELKRVAADQVDLADIPVPETATREESVAVVGSGPSGLSAAYFLALDGYQVSVYEAMPETGGMLRYGIPEHRLPRDVLDSEIENLKRYGIKIYTNTPIGKDLTLKDLRKGGARAIFLATGAWKGLKLRVPGEGHSKNVEDVTSFLRQVHLGEKRALQGKVLVIGGGHSAIDAARLALRLGAEQVGIIYRRSSREMLAEPEEVAEAEKEGVKIHYQVAPLKIESDGEKLSGIECIRTRLTQADTTGRRKPIPIESSEFFIETDYIISAIGQEPDLDFLGEGHALEVSKWKLLMVNGETLQTNIPDVFAGGDVITGPATVIEAVEAGKRGAKYIAKYLQGEDLPAEWSEEPPIGTNWTEIRDDEPTRHRLKTPSLALKERLSGFKEVNLLADEEEARKEAERCLNCGGCCECYQCVEACKAKALTFETHSQKGQSVKLDVGSVILAPGFESFDPKRFATYGYTSYPNVITSMEFERILSATGPFQGHLQRPSDRKEVRKIAWLQCIGSREINQCDNAYCSSVCCMYAIKEAVIAKEHAGSDLDATLFFMDMRTHGKGFDKYYSRAKDDLGVRFIRSRIHTIDPAGPGSDDLKLVYADDTGTLKNEIFDMVVLSTGLEISPESKELAKRLDVQLDSDGFAETSSFSPVASSRPGVFVCGAFCGPKDIPQSVMESSAASSASAALLAAGRNTLGRKKTYPEEMAIGDEEPRIGVFDCHCGINIAGVVDVPAVRDYARNLPNVVYAGDNLFTCSQDTQGVIKKVIKENRLNRVVVAACSPRTHEPLFQETIQETGLNRYLFEFANIRDQDSWVHQNEPEKATEKAKDLVRMAVSKAALLEPIERLRMDINQSALVIGGGISGMNAALNLADQGFKTYLVERAEELGGHALTVRSTWKGEDVGAYLKGLCRKVTDHGNIEVVLNAEIAEVKGFIGNFTTSLKTDTGESSIEHGAIIVATGAGPFIPDEYLYGKSDRVTIWHDMMERLDADPDLLDKAGAVAFIQCVGSREPQRPHCSKICCTASIKEAIELKKRKPDLDVYILYREIRTYGQRERLYQEARKLGVIFIRYTIDEKPVVEEIEEGKRLQITVKDHILGFPVSINVDYLNLATAIVSEGQDKISRMLKIPVHEDGFFLEAHMKLRPVDFATDGIFVCGLAHYPKPIEESIAQAQAAAGRAACVLVKEFIEIEPIVSVVDEEHCIGCGLCEASCPFGAIRLKKVEGKGFRAENLSALCKGCGVCAAACPQKAIDMKHFRDSQIFAAIEAGGLSL